jgi:hypothetical protein
MAHQPESRDEFVTAICDKELRPPLPLCPQDWKKLIQDCWNQSPEKRPSFKGTINIGIGDSVSISLTFVALYLLFQKYLTELQKWKINAQPTKRKQNSLLPRCAKYCLQQILRNNLYLFYTSQVKHTAHRQVSLPP